MLRSSASRNDIEDCTADVLSGVMLSFDTNREGSLKAYIGTAAKRRAIKDLSSLAQKGDSLTWSDFEDYIYEDIGSGIYIWEFKIEEDSGYTLLVGDVPPEKPNYISNGKRIRAWSKKAGSNKRKGRTCIRSCFINILKPQNAPH